LSVVVFYLGASMDNTPRPASGLPQCVDYVGIDDIADIKPVVSGVDWTRCVRRPVDAVCETEVPSARSETYGRVLVLQSWPTCHEYRCSYLQAESDSIWQCTLNFV